ncbi:MAG TPA: hypothetical protein VHE81_16190 [Lacipirellulaceae bacterium]|nr:hypothetical protein [Lacipirellulaceae bacterium]
MLDKARLCRYKDGYVNLIHRKSIKSALSRRTFHFRPVHTAGKSGTVAETAAAVEKATGAANEVINAIGPETFTYRDLVATIGEKLGCKRPIISVPPGLGYWTCRALGRFLGNVLITREEVQGSMEGRLFVDATSKLTDWVWEHRDSLGRRYTSEMARRLDRETEYKAN